MEIKGQLAVDPPLLPRWSWELCTELGGKFTKQSFLKQKRFIFWLTVGGTQLTSETRNAKHTEMPVFLSRSLWVDFVNFLVTFLLSV